MFVLDSVACADTFPADGSSGGAQIIAENGSSGGYAAVTGNDVYVQLAYQAQPGIIIWTQPVHVSPGNIILERGTCGIRFRNYTAGKTATVSAGLSEPAEPAMQLTSAGVAVASTGGGSMVTLYDHVVPVGGEVNLTISPIAQTYAHLQLVISAVPNSAPIDDTIVMQFNGDTGLNYDWEVIDANNAAITPGFTAGQANLAIGPYSSGDANASSAMFVWIPNYAGSIGKETISHGGAVRSTAAGLNRSYAGRWRNVAPISAIKLFGSGGTGFGAGSRFSLYGIL